MLTAIQIATISISLLISLSLGLFIFYWTYNGHIVKKNKNETDPILDIVPIEPNEPVIPLFSNKNCANEDCSVCLDNWGPKWTCDQFIDTQYWDLIQQKGPGDQYILLRKTANLIAERNQEYLSSVKRDDGTIFSITGDLSSYSTEVVERPDGTRRPWSFRVFTQPGPGRQEWCVFTQARKMPNFVLYSGNDCKQRYKADEIYVFSFWTPISLAPNLTTVQLQKNLNNPDQVRYRLRSNFHQIETGTGWQTITKIVTPSVMWPD